MIDDSNTVVIGFSETVRSTGLEKVGLAGAGTFSVFLRLVGECCRHYDSH